MSQLEQVSVSSSWVKVPENSDFPIQNIPFGVFEKSNGDIHIGTRIGDYILDLNILSKNGYFNSSKTLNNGKCFLSSTLNHFMSLNRNSWKEARNIIQNLLSSSNTSLKNNKDLLTNGSALIKSSNVKMLLPCKIGDYTDFYSSKNHAMNVGTMFRGKDNALQPNWLHLPVGYHGRASSVVPSGVPIRRPNGQLCPDIKKNPPTFGPCKLLDFELELGFFIGGKKNKMGEPISINNAQDNIFGVVLMNDWSARDIQKWEYIPLGPFNAKNFGTSISAWIITMEALDNFKLQLPKQEPLPLQYLRKSNNTLDYLYNINLNVLIQSSKMNKAQIITSTNSKHLYWSFAQQLSHHTSTGCPFNPGDLLGTGTISGTNENSRGSMLEITWRGTKPIKLSDGTERKFLNDGDKVIMTGKCKNNKYSIGFGILETLILPPLDSNLFGKL